MKRIAWRWVCVLLPLKLLLGCAGGPTSTDGETRASESSAYITPFDESDARRRARIRLELASNYFENGQPAVALDEVKQALASDPQYGPAYNLRGVIYLRLNEPRLAEDSFRKALALSPQDADVAQNYGWALCEQGRYSDANVQFAQALRHQTQGAGAKTWMTQGICYARAGDLANAQQSLLRAYELDPRQPITGYQLAQVFHKRGEYSKAQFHIRRINNSEFANAQTLWLGIKIERHLQDGVAMSQLLEQLKKRYPLSPELAAYERGEFDD